MLIDWVSCWISVDYLTPEGREATRLLGDRIARYCPKTGDIRHEIAAWDSIRSDSHQISVRATGTALYIQGSPARVCGDGCAVFGSGASARLSLAGCVDAMRLFVQHHTGIQLPPDLSLWHVTRADITGNLLLTGLDEVRQALSILRDCEGGRYRVSQMAGDSVYWSHGSALRSGKAYAKGPHLTYLMRRKDYTGKRYTLEEIEIANRLLRLELKLGNEFFRRNDWRSLTAKDLLENWKNYFSRMIGEASMSNESDLLQRLLEVAPTLQLGKDKDGQPLLGTAGQARAAHGCWLLIQSQGWERAKASYSRSSWYRNLKYLHAAGLGDADISAGRVVPLRRRIFEAQLVTSWQQLQAA